jgi:uncharacterized protein (DUF2132 family)
MHAAHDAVPPPDAAPVDASDRSAPADPAPRQATPPVAQPRNPLHGLTLQVIVEKLVEAYGWDGLADRIPVRCFQSNPTVKSSLTFLRKTPWAREKVEGLYLFLQREQRRTSRFR